MKRVGARWLVAVGVGLGVGVGIGVAPGAHAKTRRIAVVVGHNAGTEDRPPLRYAESDAGKFARLLVEVGEVAARDLALVQGRPAADVGRAIRQAAERVSMAQSAPDTRAILIFYFSGHSDGEAIELGREPLPFRELKRMLAATGADVRLVIIDACKSGSATLSKGGKPAPPFTIRLNDELLTSGEVTLTSSAADEIALESDEVEGSYFTHHLISGLRGAADVSLDNRVTLNEAYRYAYDHTVKSSTTTLDGPHHPTYDIHLSGQGELVLAYLDRLTSALELPADIERALIIDLVRDQVVVELTARAGRTVSLPAGRYAVVVMRGDGRYLARLELGEGKTHLVNWADLEAAEPGAFAARKGSLSVTQAIADPTASTPTIQLLVLGGISGVVSDSADASGALRVAVEQPTLPGWTGALHASLSGSSDGELLETNLQLRGGFALALGTDAVTGVLSFEVGPGVVWQAMPNASDASSLMLVFGPRAGVRFAISPWLWLAVEGEVILSLLKLDNEVTVTVFPSALVGVGLLL